MIDADFSRTRNGFRLRIEGHAGYGVEGEDIVCSAVSSVFYALCGYIINFKPGKIKVNELRRGLADIELHAECEDQLQLACLGLWQIANTYPAHMKVGIRAWNWKMVSGTNRLI